VKKEELPKKSLRNIPDPQKTQFALTKEERAALLPELKENARYRYLDDRTKKQLELMEKRIKDTELLYRSMKVTSQEL